jgi:hypothetical protein
LANHVICKLFHPSDRSETCLSDFQLFAKLKHEWIGHRLRTEHDLFDKILKFLDAMPSSELQVVFLRWIEKLEQIIQSDVDDGFESKLWHWLSDSFCFA